MAFIEFWKNLIYSYVVDDMMLDKEAARTDLCYMNIKPKIGLILVT